MQIALDQISAAKLTFALRRLGNWWLDEFLNLLPERVVEWLSGRGRAMLLLSADGEGATLELLSGNAQTSAASASVVSANDMPDQIMRFLRSHGIEAKDAAITLPWTIVTAINL